MKIDTAAKIDAVNACINGLPREKVAERYLVHPVTVWRWLQTYHRHGIEYFSKKRTYRRPWNKFSNFIEHKVVAIKECDPTATVSQACVLLNKKGIVISRKGVWSIWRRYGMTGFLKEKLGSVTDSRKYCFVDIETEECVKNIRNLLNRKKIKQAARILDSLSVCPDNQVLTGVPQTLLSLGRQVDLLLSQSGTIPLREYRSRARDLRQTLQKKKMYYSALRVGIEEGAALTFLEESRQLLRLTANMKKRIRRLRDPWIRYTISLLEGYGKASLLYIQDALRCARTCKAILRRIPNPHFLMGELTSLYYKLGKFREAIFWAQKALAGTSGEYRKDLYSALIGYLTVSGDYAAIPKIAKQEKLDKWGYHIRILLCRALYNLNQGNFQEACALAENALLTAKKQEIRAFFFLAVTILACSHAAAGERKQAYDLLKKYTFLGKKFRLHREYFLQQILRHSTDLPFEAMFLPDIKLAYLLYHANVTMHASKYNRARAYAESQKLMGLFERIVLFFPESVKALIRRGKDTGLPKRFLEMPAFQTTPQTFKVKFLGPLLLFKGEKRLYRARLKPKESSFLIHLACNKKQRTLLCDIYDNFWPGSQNAPRNLSHLLVRLRKVLGIPTRSLLVQRQFLQWNFFCSTDYDDFLEILAQARALQRVGENAFARHELFRAFNLIRGEPFKQMYDRWSEQKREAIINTIEKEVLCLTSDYRDCMHEKDVARILQKVSVIIPNPKEITPSTQEKDE
jgi:transposase